MGLMKKLTSAIVASSLVFSLVGTAAAAYSPTTEQAAGTRMQTLGIINGKPGVGLALNDEITRAELVTTIVRAFGKEQDAALLKGSTLFPDATNHWASGNIAMAAALVEKAGGDAIGMPDGKFNPDGKLTPAQAVAFLMKFIGVKRDASKAWPNDYLDQAVKVGLITADDAALIAPKLNENATRGLVFYMFDRAFYSYDLGAGKTFYTKYVDTQAPDLTVNPIDATTIDSKVTVTGKVSTDASEVYVGTTKVTVDANGNFSSDFALPEVKADAYSITVTARDIAGNAATQTLKVTRTTGVAASIEADDVTVAAGGTATVKAVVKDAKGNVLANQAVTGTSTVGTFDGTTFTAGKTTGTGTLTLAVGDLKKDVNVTVSAGTVASVVADAASVAPGVKVNFTAKDANGNAVTGATFTVDDTTNAWVDSNTGAFLAFKAGSFTVTATKGSDKATVKFGVYGDATQLGVTVAGQITANDNGSSDRGSYTTVTVKALDANGNLRSDYKQGITLTANNNALVIKGAVSGTATETAASGVATFKVYAPAGLAGQVLTLTANSTNASNVALTAGTGSVTIVGQTAKTVSVSTDSAFVGVASATNLGYTVKVLDQDGIQMRTGAYDVKVAVTGPAVLNNNGDTSATYTVVNGTTDTVVNNATVKLQLTSKQYTTGAITLTATIDGFGSATANVNSVFVGGAAAVKLTSSATSYTVGTASAAATPVTYTATVLDSQGAVVDAASASLPASLTLDLSGMSSTDFAAISALDATGANPLAAGSATQTFVVAKTANANQYKFQLATTGAFVGNVPVVLKGTNASTSAALTNATATLAVNAGTAAKFGITSWTSMKYLPVATPTTALTIQLYDNQMNPVAVSGKSVTVAASENNAASGDVSFDGTAGSKTYTTDANGQVKVNVTAKQYVGHTYTVTATSADQYAPTTTTVNGQPVAKNITSVYIDSTATASVSLAVEKLADAQNNVWVTPAYVTAGDTIRVKATVKDTYGVNRIANVNLGVTSTDKVFANANSFTLVDGASLTGVQWSQSNGVYTSTGITVGKAGMVSFTITDKNAPTAVSADASVLVYAGAASTLSVAEVDSSDNIAVTQNSVSGPFTLKLADAYGNAVTTNANVSVDVAVSGTEAAKVVQVGTSNTTLGVAQTLSTRGTTQFYVGVTDLTKTGNTAPATITFHLTGANVATGDAVVNLFGK